MLCFVNRYSPDIHQVLIFIHIRNCVSSCAGIHEENWVFVFTQLFYCINVIFNYQIYCIMFLIKGQRKGKEKKTLLTRRSLIICSVCKIKKFMNNNNRNSHSCVMMTTRWKSLMLGAKCNTIT